MGKVRVEFLSWLAGTLGDAGTGRQTVLDVSLDNSRTVRDFISRLASTYPRFGQIVFDTENQRLTEKISIIVNGRQLELLNGLETKLKDGDTLTFLPPIEGG